MKIVQIIKPVGMGGVERIVCSLNSGIKKSENESYRLINEKQFDDFVEHFEIKDTNNIIKYCDSNLMKMMLDLKRKIQILNPTIIQTHARKECVLVGILNKKAVHIRTQHMSEKPRHRVTFIEKWLLKNRISAWIATSETLKSEYLCSKDFIDLKKIYVVYNGVKNLVKEKKTFNIRNKYCIVSRLTKQKGIDILIDNIKNMNKSDLDFHIDIYGEGDQLTNILNLIDKYNLSEVIKYVGKTNSPSNVVKEYDALLMPSRNEGLPLTMLESMAVGTPVAIHNVGCVSEIIDNKKNGWIIDENFTWNDFFKRDNNNYKFICQQAIETYRRKFSEKNMVDSYLEIYKKVLDKM